jgi:hypothetical protein
MTAAEIVSVIKDLVTSGATIGSAIWLVFTFMKHEKTAQRERIQHEEEAQQQRLAQAERDNAARKFEARKPFNDKQLAVYSDVAGVAGRLATIADLASPEWDQNIKRFYQFFWTELSMVEDESVKKAMECFSAHLQEIIKNDSEHGASAKDFEKLGQKAYQLASALRASIASSWAVNLAEGSERSITH